MKKKKTKSTRTKKLVTKTTKKTKEYYSPYYGGWVKQGQWKPTESEEHQKVEYQPSAWRFE
jgi:hypothetical protein